jgi:CRP/FNR family transcriptional regulator, anaerobic regulatory protein
MEISMEQATDLFKRLRSFRESELQEAMLRSGKVITAGKGDILIQEGQRLDFLPIVIDGLIRVYRQWEDREILLYYVGPEQTCMMSLSSAYFNSISAANGMAMEPSEILVLPVRLIAEWQLKFPSWNEYIIHTFRSRYDELLSSFGSIAFDPIPTRVKHYLVKRAKAESSKKINLSHQTLANELGTTRVVISRILKQFEQQRFLKQFRGHIVLS